MHTLINDATNHFYMTVYDLLKGLREEYDNIFASAIEKSSAERRKLKVSHKELASAYDGELHEKKTYIRQAVTVTYRLTNASIEVIRNICNAEHADNIFQHDKMNTIGATNEDVVLHSMYCVLFRNFVFFDDLRGAKCFMNVVSYKKPNAIPFISKTLVRNTFFLTCSEQGYI